MSQAFLTLAVGEREW